MANQNNQSNPSQIELDDVAEWVGLHYGRNFENESHDKRVEWTARYAEAHGLAKPEPQKFATGDWMHLFGPGMRETRCRIVIDLEQSKMVAAQEWTGLKFEDIRGDRLKDLAESVIEAFSATGYHATYLGDQTTAARIAAGTPCVGCMALFLPASL